MSQTGKVLTYNEYVEFRETMMEKLSIKSYMGWTAFLYHNADPHRKVDRPKVKSKPVELMLYLSTQSVRICKLIVYTIDRAMLSPSEQVVYDAILSEFDGKNPVNLLAVVKYCDKKMYMAASYFINFLHNDDFMFYSIQELEQLTINKFTR